MEQLFRRNETRKFYEMINRSRNGFTPQADTCLDAEGNLLMDKGEIMDRWKQFYNEHLNEEAAHEDGVEAQLGALAADEQFPAFDLSTVGKEIR